MILTNREFFSCSSGFDLQRRLFFFFYLEIRSLACATFRDREVLPRDNSSRDSRYDWRTLSFRRV